MRVRSIVLLGATCLLTACGTATTAMTDSSVTIPSDRFLPAVSQSVSGGAVTFHNADADAHTVTSLSGAAVAFELVIMAGGTPTKTDQVAANPGAHHPDEPMAGVIVAARSS